MRFACHGSFRISNCGRVIIVILNGPHNLESILSYIETFKKTVSIMGIQEPWASFNIAINNANIIPEAEEHMEKFAKWREEHNMTCYTSSLEHIRIGKKLALIQWNKIFRETTGGVKQKAFLKTEEALAWLEDNGFPCKLSSEDHEFIRNCSNLESISGLDP